ncbi:hypothetical protein CLOSBL3_30054 [Clostridiaceae bacterium BL-3]|jgi:hypothetical protein|nr:hypothetical protein CLOSBL3_30054 [Clostridiaceae bacterium BL-3]
MFKIKRKFDQITMKIINKLRIKMTVLHWLNINMRCIINHAISNIMNKCKNKYDIINS